MNRPSYNIGMKKTSKISSCAQKSKTFHQRVISVLIECKSSRFQQILDAESKMRYEKYLRKEFRNLGINYNTGMDCWTTSPVIEDLHPY